MESGEQEGKPEGKGGSLIEFDPGVAHAQREFVPVRFWEFEFGGLSVEGPKKLSPRVGWRSKQAKTVLFLALARAQMQWEFASGR